MKTYIYTLLFLVVSFFSNAQNPASVDLNFGPQPGLYGVAYAIAIQPDGKILIGGSYIRYHGITANYLIRINVDGSRDNSFNPVLSGSVYSIVIQSDGKILVASSEPTSYNNYSVIRLNIDGTKDTSFNINGFFNSYVSCIVLQDDGKIIAGGDFYTFQGSPQNRIIRFNNDGSVDSSFNIGSGFNSKVNSIIKQPDGKIIVGGNFSIYNSITKNHLIRLNNDGSIDNTFDIGTGFNSIINEIKLQIDGKIIIGGDFTTYNDAVFVGRLARLNIDGSIDTSFTTGTGFNSATNTISIQPDGKIIVGGNFTTFNNVTQNHLIRLNDDGSKDSTFNIGTGFGGDVYTTLLQTDGKIIIGGVIKKYQEVVINGLTRLNDNGDKDMSFNKSGFNDLVSAITIQNDGKILVGGDFITYKGLLENRIIRLNPDGTKDTTFNTGIGFNNLITKILLQPDGKIIISGYFTTYQGSIAHKLIRLNSDGSRDTSFISPVDSPTIRTIALQPDGKILVGGLFDYYRGLPRKNFARLNNDGSVDTTFNVGTGFDNFVYATCIQPDSKIIVGGDFSIYNGTTANKLLRLNNDGSVDTTFNVGMGFQQSPTEIIMQPDNKLLVGGNFYTFQGLPAKGLIRLNSDGTKDTTFTSGTIGFNGSVNSLALQNNRKIIVGGSFTTYQGINEIGLIRLNSDGSKDASFITGYGFDYYIQAVAIQNDGKILVGGDYEVYNTNGNSAHLVRLNGDSVLANEDFEFTNTIDLYPNPFKNKLNILNSNEDNVEIQIYNLQGTLIYENKSFKTQIYLETLKTGLYLAKLKTQKGIIVKKIIKE